MPSWRRCFFKCPSGDSLFTFPTDMSTRQKWTEFVFGDVPPRVKNAFVCARHFTDDCFLNKGMFVSGQVARLSLKPGATPSLKTGSPEVRPKPEPTEYVIPPWPQPATPVKSTRSVSTQLSVGTLRQHYRSKAVQTVITTVTSPDALTEPENGSTCRAKRARKRPREEEEEDEEDEEVQLYAPYEPTDSDSESDLPQFTEMEPEDGEDDDGVVREMEPEDGEDDDEERFLVFGSCLRELFESCPGCGRRCNVHKLNHGTLVEFTQDCPHCAFRRTWHSQPPPRDSTRQSQPPTQSESESRADNSTECTDVEDRNTS